jgi:hypothetical protein
VINDPLDEETALARQGAPYEEIMAARENPTLPSDPSVWQIVIGLVLMAPAGVPWALRRLDSRRY